MAYYFSSVVNTLYDTVSNFVVGSEAPKYEETGDVDDDDFVFIDVMEGSDGSPPSSLWMVRAAELFPKGPIEKEDDKLNIPFQELAGESVRYLGYLDDGVLALSNYRLFMLKSSTCSETSVPLSLIESVQALNIFQIMIICKDASTLKCSFTSPDKCTDWIRRISIVIGVPDTLEALFAFPFYAWASETIRNDNNEWSGRLQKAGRFEDDFKREVDRLQFDLNGTWRISQANSEFKLCPSYPTLLLVPCCISDDALQNVASFRSSRRIPAVVWRHKQSGAVIARCSQPEVGWLGWRNAKDEQLLKALADACAFDRGEQSRRQNLFASGESTPSSAEGSHEEVVMDEVRKVLIVDARSYTSAVTNRARGGGCECPEYYPYADIQFMSLGNIHAIRKSFHSLRTLCASAPDVPNWLGGLERSLWLQHLSGLLASSMTVCHAIEKNGRPVLVHCSDGWDRTPQIVATAQLCLDPYYRTVEGFRTLVEREWLSYGHKFSDRCGHGPGSDELNERCPVFLQWLDGIHQIHRQFPCSFEFNMAYLIKLAQHSHSCLFGTFLCNTIKERIENTVFDRTFSVWPLLSGPMYRNPLYVPNKEKVLWPAHNVRDLTLWSEVYLGSLGNQNSTDFPPNANEANQESSSPMTKTRSYGDLISAGNQQNGLTRRSSDPNMIVDTHLITPLNLSSGNSVNDESSVRGASPEAGGESLTDMIQATTEKLQHLTNELNQSDEDAEICNIINENYKACDLFNQATKDGVSGRMIRGGGGSSVGGDTESPASAASGNHEYASSPFYTHTSKQFTTDYSIGNENSNGNGTAVASNANNGNVAGNNGTKRMSPNGATISNNGNGYEASHTSRNLNPNGNRLNSNSNQIYDDVDGEFITEDCDGGMMKSVDLKDTMLDGSPTNSSQSQNLWHGSVETSTDTLVPIEQLQANNGDQQKTESIRNSHSNVSDKNLVTLDTQKMLTSSLYKDLPEVHCKPKLTSNSLNSAMDESIIIQPEHRKLEISNNGKCDSVVSNIINTTSSHRRRRTSSTNSKPDILSPNKHVNGSTSPSATYFSRFSTPGARSLPLTPPGATDRPTVAITCPDGLAHALSEQNIRLQQIVYEHKAREDALQRELNGMRMALLKRTCPHCNNQPIPNDEQQQQQQQNQQIRPGLSSSHIQQQHQQQQQQQSTTTVSGVKSAVSCHSHSSILSSSAAPMEACKHAASPPRNDRGPLKATTASN